MREHVLVRQQAGTAAALQGNAVVHKYHSYKARVQHHIDHPPRQHKPAPEQPMREEGGGGGMNA